MIRICACILLFISALLAPLWCFAIAALLYAFFFSPYEPLIMAVLIDAQFGDTSRDFPFWYTASVCSSIVLAFMIRPFIIRV